MMCDKEYLERQLKEYREIAVNHYNKTELKELKQYWKGFVDALDYIKREMRLA